MTYLDIVYKNASLASLLHSLTGAVRRGVTPKKELIEAINFKYDRIMEATRDHIATEILKELNEPKETLNA